jgi:D-tyrosyl-tRNA(Tyr) deacylase
MKCVVQRVSEARVRVAGEVVGEIGPGQLVLACVQRRDTEKDVAWSAAKLVSLRIFPNTDGSKSFDRDVREVGGGILLVSQFTIAADTTQGRRPSFTDAAGGEHGKELFDRLVASVAAAGVPVATGRFGAEMKVELINDGPATFIVESPFIPSSGTPGEG